MRSIVLIAHNLRSCHNVGALLRTADGLGVARVFLTGYTPYPAQPGDRRLPHHTRKLDRQIHKTALGAEKMQPWDQMRNLPWLLLALKIADYQLAALEQAPDARPLAEYLPPANIALIVGREVEGLEEAVLKTADVAVEIPMLGQKESFNVAQAAAMALYHMRFAD